MGMQAGWARGVGVGVAVVVALAGSGAALALPTYTVTVVASPSQLEGANPAAVNDQGQVAGSYKEQGVDPWQWRIWFWDNGPISKLHDATTGVRQTYGVGLSNDGTVAGYSVDGADPWASRPLVCFDTDADGVPDTVERLGSFGGNQGAGHGVNAAGHVTGYSEDAGGVKRAFLWVDGNGNQQYDAGELTDIGDLVAGGEAEGRSLSDDDVVVGVAEGDIGYGFTLKKGFVWGDEDGDGTPEMIELGSLDPSSAFRPAKPCAISASNGFAVGSGDNADGDERACMWTDTDGDGVPEPDTITSLGTLGGWATAWGVNSLGMAVGSSYDTTESTTHGFLYAEGSLTDINELLIGATDWEVTQCADISDTGYILASASYQGQSGYVLRLDPVADLIPEPCTLALLGTGAIGLLTRRRRR